MTQRQDARDAKERVQELNLGEVAVGLTQNTEGDWAVAVRAQRELSAVERERILNAAGDVGVDFAEIGKVSIQEGSATPFIRRGEYVYKRAKSARGYLLEELDLLHDAGIARWRSGEAQLLAMDFEGFLASLHDARDWANDQLDHLIEITEEALK